MCVCVYVRVCVDLIVQERRPERFVRLLSFFLSTKILGQIIHFEGIVVGGNPLYRSLFHKLGKGFVLGGNIHLEYDNLCFIYYNTIQKYLIFFIACETFQTRTLIHV